MRRYIISDSILVEVPQSMTHSEFAAREGLDGIRVRIHGDMIAVNLDALLDLSEEEVISRILATFDRQFRIIWYL
jgi:hypothetical protein